MKLECLLVSPHWSGIYPCLKTDTSYPPYPLDFNSWVSTITPCSVPGISGNVFSSFLLNTPVYLRNFKQRSSAWETDSFTASQIPPAQFMELATFRIFVSDEFSSRPLMLFHWDQKLHICLSALSPMRATCPVHHFLLVMIMPVLLGEDYE